MQKSQNLTELKKILVVEDDESFRKTISDVLSGNFEVLTAPNGISAREILSIQKVDVVVSDVQMPGFSGLELLEWSATNNPVPFVIMTGFSTLFETRSAHDLGAKGFISKPFKISELTLLLNKILVPPNPLKMEKKDGSQFCRVSIEEFITKPKIDFDVYIKLSETKIIKIANKGEALSREQLNHYKSKGVRYLYILKEDFGKLIDFNLSLAKVMKNRVDISQVKKAAFLKYTGEVLLERTFTDGIDSEKLEDVNSFLKLTFDMISDSGDITDLLGIVSDHSGEIYAHSVGMSLYSVLIAKQLGIGSNVSLFKLSMAGLFHDVGNKEIDKEILKKPRHLVTSSERSMIESHVLRGQEILSGMKDIPPDVSRLVSEHHEDQEGMGYPLRKTRKDQHPLSRIIQCANIFLERVSRARAENKPVVPGNIIDLIETLFEKRVDAECLQALRKIFNISSGAPASKKLVKGNTLNPK